MSVPCMHWQSVGNWSVCVDMHMHVWHHHWHRTARTCKLYFWTETFLIVHFYCHMHISNVRLYCISTAAARLNVWFVHYLVYSVFLFLVLCPSPIYRCNCMPRTLSLYKISFFTLWAVYCMHTKMMLLYAKSTAANVQTAETWTDTSEWQWCISIQ